VRIRVTSGWVELRLKMADEEERKFVMIGTPKIRGRERERFRIL